MAAFFFQAFPFLLLRLVVCSLNADCFASSPELTITLSLLCDFLSISTKLRTWVVMNVARNSASFAWFPQGLLLRSREQRVQE